MLEVLLLEPDPKISELITNALYEVYDALVTAVSDPREAVAQLEFETEFEVFIVRDILAEQLISKINRPTVVLGKFQESANVKVLAGDFDILKLGELISTLSGKKLAVKESKSEFIPVAINHLFGFKKACCDLYLKLNKQEGDPFIKRFRQDDDLDQATINKYASSKVQALYIRASDKTLFNCAVINHLTKMVSDISAKSNEEELNLYSDIYDITSELISNEGITPEVKKVIDATLGTMARSVKGNSKLGPLIKSLLDSKSSFRFKHSHLISILGHKVLKRVDWGVDKNFELNFERLVFISYFHDLLLPNDKLAKINSKVDLYEANLTKEEQEIVNEHANKVATLTLSYGKSPQGSDIILRQHHGTSNGIGFVEHFNSSISPLAILFIVLEDFVIALLEGETGQMDRILENLFKKYQQPSYRKIVEKIQEIVTVKP